MKPDEVTYAPKKIKFLSNAKNENESYVSKVLANQLNLGWE